MRLADPACDSLELRGQIEALRARLCQTGIRVLGRPKTALNLPDRGCLAQNE